MGKGSYLGGGTLVRANLPKLQANRTRDRLNAIADKFATVASDESAKREAKLQEFASAKKKPQPTRRNFQGTVKG